MNCKHNLTWTEFFGHQDSREELMMIKEQFRVLTEQFTARISESQHWSSKRFVVHSSPHAPGNKCCSIWHSFLILTRQISQLESVTWTRDKVSTTLHGKGWSCIIVLLNTLNTNVRNKNLLTFSVCNRHFPLLVLSLLTRCAEIIVEKILVWEESGVVQLSAFQNAVWQRSFLLTWDFLYW